DALTSLRTALSPADRTGEFWMVSGRENILNRARSMIEEAQHVMALAAPADCYGDIAEAVAQAQSRGCRVYLPSITASPAHETLVSRAMLLLVDGRDVLAGTINSAQTCQAVVSSNEALVAAVTGWFAHRQQPQPVVGIDTSAPAQDARDDATRTPRQERAVGWMA